MVRAGRPRLVRLRRCTSAMTIVKKRLLELIDDLPEEVEIDEVMYRLYLRQ